MVGPRNGTRDVRRTGNQHPPHQGTAATVEEQKVL